MAFFQKLLITFRVIFICAGEANNELEFIKYLQILYDKHPIEIIMVDILYEDPKEIEKIKKKFTDYNCTFLKSFTEMLEYCKKKEKADLIVSYHYQFSTFFKDLAEMCEKKWDLICTLQELGGVCKDIPWIDFPHMTQDILNPIVYDGNYFNEIANGMLVNFQKNHPDFIESKFKKFL